MNSSSPLANYQWVSPMCKPHVGDEAQAGFLRVLLPCALEMAAERCSRVSQVFKCVFPPFVSEPARKLEYFGF